ncbi:MAG: hypothetical protein U0414_20115 [Polyangiaceae bacterium]
MSEIGEPRVRVDGRAKVTGAAEYAADIPVSGLVHAVIVPSAIAKGRVASIDVASAAASAASPRPT